MHTPLRLIPCALLVASAIVARPAAARQIDEAELNRLVLENSSTARTTITDGILRIEKDGGWARTRRIHSDFTLVAEFRLVSAEAEAQIGIRTINVDGEWPRRGYRLRLSASTPPTLVATGYRATQRSAAPVPISAEEWHSLTIAGTGPSITVTIDGQPVGSYEIEVHAGALLFQANRGAAEFRQITIKWPTVGNVVRMKDYKGRREFETPRLKREAKPNYPENPRLARIEGIVTLEIVVLADGTVGAVELTSLLNPELEHASLAAIRQWKFKPGLLHGTPVASVVEVEMSFSLRR